jgi:hypothetical protein
VLEKYNPAQWPGGEDGFFGLHVSLLGGKVAGPVAQSLFAVQDRLVFIPLGFHQPNRLSKPARFLLRYICPPSRRLL